MGPTIVAGQLVLMIPAIAINRELILCATWSNQWVQPSG